MSEALGAETETGGCAKDANQLPGQMLDGAERCRGADIFVFTKLSGLVQADANACLGRRKVVAGGISDRGKSKRQPGSKRYKLGAEEEGRRVLLYLPKEGLIGCQSW